MTRKSAQSQARGFTLIELLIVVSIIGLLAALAIPRVTSLKSRAFDAMLRSDLRTLAAVQETYYEENLVYAPDGALTTAQFRPSENVTVTIDSATVTGWGAHADHAGTTLTCYIAYAGASNASVTCN
jgi:prepilin-type N-terminal cleavage/methylation domain-containing protein